MDTLSVEYKQANAAYSEAYKAYIPIRDAYRAGNLPDDIFVAAMKEFDTALAVWDAAFLKEQSYSITQG